MSCSTVADIPEELTSVAVAVKGGTVDRGGNGSQRAARWAVENLMPKVDRFILVHVMPTITAIPTPSGDFISVAELDENLVRLYVEDVKLKVEEIFIPYIKLCKRKKTETIVLEDDCPAAALLRFVSEAAIDCLVLGSCSTNFITRKLKGPGVPTTVLGCVPNSCNVYVVSKHGIITKSADLTSSSESSSSPRPRSYGESSSGFIESLHELHDSSVKRVQETPGLSSVSENSYPNSHALVLTCSPTRTSLDISQKFGYNLQPTIFEHHHETWPTSEQAEMEQLRQELQTTLEMYERACEELVHTENKVQLLTYECLGEARRATNALEREKQLREIAANVKEKHLQALKEVENAKALLLKEAQERERAELKAQKEFLEKKELIDTLLLSDKRYRRYTVTEIEIATNFFSETNIIGEGGYGKVYKCNLDHTPVAVKVLCPDAADKKDEFLTEVEVLSQLQHPHIVLLLGACPENRCLIYEFMDNGSLDEYVFHENGKPPLPWFVRFRIVYEVACALAFLHNSKPEPIVHRDMKPGNILLDKNYTSKIGDIGLAKLIDDVVPDNITEYRGSVLAGTIHYMDPEYHRTGTVRPKSDLYALGVIILQMLTARQPNRLLLIVENAINNGSFADIVDKSITDWPLGETEELAQIALKCSNLRCRDRPDLDTEVLPLLRRLKDFAGTGAKLEKCSISAPSHFFCPILQEVMEDPYIAADGFSYEHGAIKAWLERQNASPVTKVKLQHSMLIPDRTLRSAIQEWKSPRKHSGSF